MGILKRWCNALQGEPTRPLMEDERQLSKRALKDLHVFRKNYPVEELARRMCEKTGVQLTPEEANDIVQEAYLEEGLGAIPFWNVFEDNYGK